MKNFILGLAAGSIIVAALFLGYYDGAVNKAKATAARETVNAIRQSIYEDTGIKFDLLDIDSMDDDELLRFTGDRAKQYQSRFHIAPKNSD